MRTLSLASFAPALAAILLFSPHHALGQNAEPTTDTAAGVDADAATAAATAPAAMPVEGSADAAASPVVAANTGAADLPELVVTATRHPSDVRLLPRSLSVIGRDEIARAGRDQLPDALAGTPGVHIQKTNPGGGSPFVRGLTGKQVVLVVDGIRLNNALYRAGPHQYLNTIDPWLVDRIEVLRGPGSVLYGSDALGGVVHLQTRMPAAVTDGVRPGAAFGAGSADRSLRGRLELDGHARDTGWLVGGSAKHFGDLRAGAGVRQPYTGYDEAAADLKLVRAVDGGRLHLIGAAQLHRAQGVPKTSEITLGGKPHYEYDPQIRGLAYLQLVGDGIDNPVVDRVHASAHTQFHGEGEAVVAAPGRPEIRERNDARSVGAFMHLARDLPGGHTLGWGVDGNFEIVSSHRAQARPDGTWQGVRPAFPDDASALLFGAYVEDTWAPIHRLRIDGAVRATEVRASGLLPDPAGRPVELDFATRNLAGQLGVAGEPLDGWILYGHVGRGFRAPNMEDFFGKIDFASEIPNTGLEPETSFDLEAGVRLRFAHVRLDAAGFRSQYRDLIDRVAVGTDADGDGRPDQVQRRNIGRARMIGGEADLRILPAAGLELRSVVSYTQGDVLTNGPDGWSPAEPLRRVPPLQGLAQIRVDLPRDLWLMPELVWADRQDRLSPGDIADPRVGPDGTPGFAVAHLRAGADFGADGRLTLGLENLLDKAYKTHGSGVQSPGRGVIAEYSRGF